MTDDIQKNPNNSQGLLFVDRMMDTVDMVLGQFTSGRWILTVVAAIILLRICWMEPAKIIEFKEILMVIIYAYFQRGEKQVNEPKKTENGV